MPDKNDGQISMNELKQYAEEVRAIKQSLDVAEASFRIFDWYYYTVAGLVLVGTGVNAFLTNAYHLTMHESLVFVWVPIFVLSGGAEMLAWTWRSTREKLPLLTPAFARYLVAGGGAAIGLLTVTVLLLRPGFPVPGIILVLIGTVLCVTVQYVHFSFLLEALALVVLGLLFILIGAQGEAYFIVDGILVSTAFALAGVIEGVLTRRSSHG